MLQCCSAHACCRFVSICEFRVDRAATYYCDVCPPGVQLGRLSLERAAHRQWPRHPTTVQFGERGGARQGELI